MSTTDDVAEAQLLPGVWQVDPASSEVGFGARGMFGLAHVRGTFKRFDGTLTVDRDGARGELRVQASTLDTGNARRDKHLRSADFFDVDAYPTVTFELTGVSAVAGGPVTIAGVLKIRETALAIETPATVETSGTGRITLGTTLDVDRDRAGVGWSKFGMIKGPAQLRATIALKRQD